MGTRANSAGYTSALGLNAINAAQGTANTASGNVKVPESFAGIDSLASGFDQVGKLLNSDTTKNLVNKVGGWFGDSTPVNSDQYTETGARK